jgi:hypothetical protein
MLDNIIDKKMNEILGDYMTKNGVETGDITPEQGFEWDALVQKMAKLMAEITEQNKPKIDVIELPMPYVLTMLDALQAIKKHKLYSIIGDAKDTEEHIDIVIEEFLEPIAMSENVDDIEIALYD